MYCLSCQYDLARLEQQRCPECGRGFDPANPRTFDTRRRRRSALVGVAAAMGMLGLLIGGMWILIGVDYGAAHRGAMPAITVFGTVVGVSAAAIAGWNRSWLGRIPLLLVGVLAVWLGLFVGAEMYYRVWQASPDPPQEAFADTAPMGALLLGWLPGAIIVGPAFVIALALATWRRRRGWRRSNLRTD